MALIGKIEVTAPRILYSVPRAPARLFHRKGSFDVLGYVIAVLIESFLDDNSLEHKHQKYILC